MINGKKVAGVVSEFNPFHKGHEYLLQGIRQDFKADYIVTVMSGDFVQRGEPAFFSKFERAEKAVNKGIDLVLQLPVLYSLASSEYFAYGAIKILEELSFVDILVFGSESYDLESLKKLARFFLREKEGKEEEYQRKLKNFVAQGNSYPKAREMALESFFPGKISSNDGLGISYLMALEKLSSKMEVGIIPRNFHLASAHSIRNDIRDSCGKDCDHRCYSEMERLYPFLRYRLMELKRDKTPLDSFFDVAPDLARRVESSFEKKLPLSEWIQYLKGKNYTYSRVSRALLHILLDIGEEEAREEMEKASSYHRVLASGTLGRDLLSYLPKNSILRLGNSLKEHPDWEEERMMKWDLFAGQLFQEIYLTGREERREKFIKL